MGGRRIVKKTERLDQARSELERAEREVDYQRAAELRHGEIPELERKLAEADSREVADEQPAVYLREVLLPRGQLMGWCPGNYAGYPFFQFYFPASFVLMAGLSLAVPMTVAPRAFNH